ncbi:MAG: hypothetical protein FWC73_04905 [Defluviitaleaceae bacterium]|nr:hypothetical protein [Defluviitaleaceae bacterium]
MVTKRKIYYLALTFFAIVLLYGCGRNIAAPIEYDENAYKWTVERIVLADDFLFKQRQIIPPEIIFSPYIPSSDKSSGDALTVSLFFENIMDLIAFRDGNIYIHVLSPDVIVHTDDLHYTLISQVNYIERYIDIFRYASGALVFGGIDFAHHIRFNNERNITTLYYVDSRERQGNISNTLFMVPWATDDDKPAQLPPFRGSSIWHRYSPRRPFVAYTDEYIILNYIDGNSYVLGYMRHFDYDINYYGDIAHYMRHFEQSTQFVEVLRYDFAIGEDGRMTGRIPIYAAGDTYGIYFQVITLDDEHLDFGGESKLYYFCFESGNYKRILYMDDSITYINGNNGIIVYNYYSVDNPRVMTGRIVSLDDNWSVIIPHVTPVNDISYSRIEDDFIFIVTREHIIIYNLQAESFHYIEVSSLSTGPRSNIRMSGSQFGWLSFDNNSDIVFYRIQLIQ